MHGRLYRHRVQALRQIVHLPVRQHDRARGAAARNIAERFGQLAVDPGAVAGIGDRLVANPDLADIQLLAIGTQLPAQPLNRGVDFGLASGDLRTRALVHRDDDDVLLRLAHFGDEGRPQQHEQQPGTHGHPPPPAARPRDQTQREDREHGHRRRDHEGQRQ